MKKILIVRPLSNESILELGLEDLYVDDQVELRAVAYVDGELVASEDFQRKLILNPLAPRVLEVPHGTGSGYQNAVVTADDILVLNSAYQHEWIVRAPERFPFWMLMAIETLQTKRIEGALDYLKLLVG